MSAAEKRVVLIGHPVGHSLSPAMQNAAFRATGLDIRYEAVDVSPKDLADYVAMLRGGFYLGANVTLPHKRAVVELMDWIDPAAKSLGAVNTVVVARGRLRGYNTDVHGALAGLLSPFATQLARSTVLVLGAGGGARAVVAALARVGRPSLVTIAARRPEAAAKLAALGGLQIHTEWVGWKWRGDALARSSVVINCTPIGLDGDDPLLGQPLTGRLVLDLAYMPGGTPLVRRAQNEGCPALQGDGMLLHQGAKAFRLWTGVEPPLEAMRLALAEAIRG